MAHPPRRCLLLLLLLSLLFLLGTGLSHADKIADSEAKTKVEEFVDDKKTEEVDDTKIKEVNDTKIKEVNDTKAKEDDAIDTDDDTCLDSSCVSSSSLSPVSVEFPPIFAPVLSIAAVRDPLASKANSRLLCAEMGGYLATEPTLATHMAVFQAAQQAGGGKRWFAYLGADTRDSNGETNNNTKKSGSGCPPPLQSREDIAFGGATCNCEWRWREGRWRTLHKEFFDIPKPAPGAAQDSEFGVKFFVGNHHALKDLRHGPVVGFASYFQEGKGKKVSAEERRPGCLLANDLLAVGDDTGAHWSDNLDSGGYSYAGYTYSGIITRCGWDKAAREATKENFFAVCEFHAPAQITSELDADASSSREKWWLVYLIIFAILGMGFVLLTTCCQDREDDDEHGDEVPEWVEREAEGLVRSKSFVSQRALEFYDDGHDYMAASGHWDGSQASVEEFNADQADGIDASDPNGAYPPDFSRVHILDRNGKPSS